MAYRNPSPPPESKSSCEADRDQVSETVLSKSWLLSVMLNTVKDTRYCRPSERHAQQPSCEQQGSKEQTGEEDSQKILHHHGDDDDKIVSVMELDAELEYDLCKLWDASIDKDVAAFLHEHNAGPLLLHVSLRSMAPRLSEICIGIVANLVCHQSVAGDISRDEETVSLICDSLFSTDPVTLVETSRLILTCLSHPSLQHHWTSALNTSDIKDQLLFILSSSTHEELVAKVLQVIEKLLDVSQLLLDTWSTPELVSVIHEASSLASSASDLSHHLMLLQLISTTSNGVDTLSKCEKEVVDVIRKYFSLFLEKEDCEFSETETTAYEMTAAMSVLNILLENGYDKSELSDCIEIKKALQLMQAKEHSGTQDGHGGLEKDDITLLLKENVDKLVKKLK